MMYNDLNIGITIFPSFAIFVSSLSIFCHELFLIFPPSFHSPFIPPFSLICLRAVCGVASIQPVMSIHNSIPPCSPNQLLPQSTVPTLPPGTVGVSGGDNAPSPGHLQNPGPPQMSSPEQNGILDWLRKLRLHKYYPVFKQLTMEEVGGIWGRGSLGYSG